MLTVAWLLGVVGWGLTAGWPVQVSTWPEENVSTKAKNDGVENPSFYQLPVYQHAARPLVPHEIFQPRPLLGVSVFQTMVVPELFRPQPELPPVFNRPLRRPLPPELHPLLFPTNHPHQPKPETRGRAVEVWCGTDQVTVRVDRLQVNAHSPLMVGSCQADHVSSRFLFFHFRPAECGGRSQVVGGQLVYTHILWSTPPRPPQGHVIRVMPLQLPIHCHYNRFHYTYQVGFRPYVQQATFLKSMRSKLSFSLVVSNAQWEPLPPGHWLFLGEPVYFVAEAETLLPGERLYLDSCFVTSSKDPNIGPKVEVITNYGCMIDSRREGSRSWIWSGGGSVVKFSVDAFLFSPDSHVMFLHCSMSVDVATSQKSKSCNYNQARSRWEELQPSTSVCACCDFKCADSEKSLSSMVSSPGWRTRQNGVKKKMKSFQAEEVSDWQREDNTEGRLDSHLPKVFKQAKKTDLKEDSIGQTPALPSGTERQVATTLQLSGVTHQVDLVLKEKSPTTDSFQTLHPRPKSILGVEGSSSRNVSSRDFFSSFGSDGSTAVPIKMCSDGEEVDCDYVPRTEKRNKSSDSLFSQHGGKFGHLAAADSTATPRTSAGRSSVHHTFKSNTFDSQKESGRRLDLLLNPFESDEGSGENDWTPERPEKDNMLPGLQTRALESGWADHHGELVGRSCADGFNCDSGTNEIRTPSRGQHTRAVKMNEVHVQAQQNSISAATKALQESPSHSAKVTLTTLPDSSFMADRWAHFWGL